MAGSTAKLSAHIKTIAQSWPADPFRPNMQLQNFLLSLSTHPRLTPQAVRATQALKANELQKKVCFALNLYFFSLLFFRRPTTTPPPALHSRPRKFSQGVLVVMSGY